MKKKIIEWLNLNWNHDLVDDFLCAVALLGVIVFTLGYMMGGPK